MKTTIVGAAMPVELVEAFDAMPGPRSTKLRRAVETYVWGSLGEGAKDMAKAAVALHGDHDLADLTSRLSVLTQAFLALVDPSVGGPALSVFELIPLCNRIGMNWAEVEPFDEGSTLVMNGKVYGTRATARLLFSEFRSRATPPADLDIDQVEAEVMAQLSVSKP